MSVHCPECGAVASYGQELGHRTGCSHSVVGHKTFDTGEIDPDTGFPRLVHQPLTKADADALMAAVEAADAERKARLPDEKAAIRAMMDGWIRLKELGWGDGIYCPKDGSHFQIIELGSTGIHDCSCSGEWPRCTWTTFDKHDCYPSSQAPALFKRYREDQAKYDAEMAERRKRFAGPIIIGDPQEPGDTP